jgi:hypothetical protein
MKNSLGFHAALALGGVALFCGAGASLQAADKDGKEWKELTPKNGLTKQWRAGGSKNDVAGWLERGVVQASPEDPRAFVWSKAGPGVIFNGEKGRTKNLVSVAQHGDIEAHIEFMIPARSNSGVYFMGRYEVQVLDSFGKEKAGVHDCGAIYERWDPKRGKGREGYEGHPPRVNASRKPGEWQTFDVIFRAPRFDKQGNKTRSAEFVKVVHNGTVIHEKIKLSGPTRGGMFADEAATGPLMLQGDHGPVAYRNIRIRSLD